MSDICLISMPYETLELPSIGISILVAALKKEGLSAKAVYPKFWFAEKIGIVRYAVLSKLVVTDDLLPEWTFSGSAFIDFKPDNKSFLTDQLKDNPIAFDSYPDILGKDPDMYKILWEIREDAKNFIDEAAQRVLDLKPKIIGCSSTFQQHCASLALLRKVRELDENVFTIIGGANCEGIMGQTIKNFFPWVDYVVSGEADHIFPQFCKELLEKGESIKGNDIPDGIFAYKIEKKRVMIETDDRDDEPIYLKNIKKEKEQKVNKIKKLIDKHSGPDKKVLSLDSDTPIDITSENSISLDGKTTYDKKVGKIDNKTEQIKTNGINVNYVNKVIDMDPVPIPDYDDYFEQLNDYSDKDSIFPCLLMESSRGCWWGEKQCCSFCGLNDETLKFRSKSPQRVIEEIEYLSKRHSITNFRMTDNILDMEYFKTVIPQMGLKKEEDYQFYYETKSNLIEQHLKELVTSGIRWIHPGIESFHDGILKLLNKGTLAIHNVAMLKYAMENGINVQWYFLCGIPNENDDWYKEMAEWLPSINHLQPPAGVGMSHIRFNRFTEYHNNQAKYNLRLFPIFTYLYLYPLTPIEMDDIAYFYDDLKHNKSITFKKNGVSMLNKIVKDWQKMIQSYFGKEKRINLVVSDDGKQSIITDTRPCAKQKEFVLTALSRLIYQKCRQPIQKDKLFQIYLEETDLSVNIDEFNAVIMDLCEKKLILSLDGYLLSLALQEPKLHLMKKRDFLVGLKIGKSLIQ